MLKMQDFDLEGYRRELERDCELVLETYTAQRKTEEAFKVAESRIDGIFAGVLAVAKGFSRRPWELNFMDMARQVSESAHRRLLQLRAVAKNI